MTPAEGMHAHLDLQGGAPAGVLLPIHWATFNLAPHPWAEPGEGTVEAAGAAGQRIALPRPGEPFEPGAERIPDVPWWRTVARVPAGGWGAPALTDGHGPAPDRTAVEPPPAAGAAPRDPGADPERGPQEAAHTP